LIDAPNEALAVIHSFIGYVRGASTAQVFMDQRACTQIDFDAESLLAALALEARKQHRTAFAGYVPTDPAAREISMATGLPHVLGDVPPAPDYFHIFDLYCGHKRVLTSPFEATDKERISTKVVEYINRCLMHYDHELTDDAKCRLGNMVGEVLANCEDHSATSTWWIAAYLRRSHPIGDCRFTIFNFGRTIAASLTDLPEDALLRQDIERLVKRHRMQGLFSPSWTEENLWTLYALQGGVSRHNREHDRVGDRGQGTADMIQFFQELGQAGDGSVRPTMAIVSGSTHIRLDGRFPLTDRLENGKRVRLLALNDDNDISKPPAKGIVRTLKSYFPGTLIAGRFFLDKRHLQDMATDHEDRPRRVSQS